MKPTSQIYTNSLRLYTILTYKESEKSSYSFKDICPSFKNNVVTDQGLKFKSRTRHQEDEKMN